jgi:hypothetical protein
MDRVKNKLTGSVDGTPVTVEFVEDDVHDLTLRATEVHVPYTPNTTTIRFNVRWGQDHFARDIREGLIRDIELGDPAFDREYVVDAAPEDVVRELFDAPTRARMLAGRYRVWTHKTTLLVEKSDWIEDLNELAEIVALALDLVRRLEPATAAARERHRTEGSAGYRSMKTDDEIAADRAAEIAAMSERETKRGEAHRLRARRYQWVFGSIVVLILAVVGAVILWHNLR